MKEKKETPKERYLRKKAIMEAEKSMIDLDRSGKYMTTHYIGRPAGQKQRKISWSKVQQHAAQNQGNPLYKRDDNNPFKDTFEIGLLVEPRRAYAFKKRGK